MRLEKHGFTVVELLTVIAIMAMLVGLLAPALNKVGLMAKETKQKAQITGIEMALMAFKSDYGDYPPSDWILGSDYCGAQKLTEALLGRDLLGFHPKSSWTATDFRYYPDPTDSDYQVLLDASLQERRGPYLELTTANVFRLENLFYDTGEYLKADTFVLCDSFGVKKVPVGEKTMKAGTPILYYQANTTSNNIGRGLNLDEWIYDARDNWPLVDLGTVTPDGRPGREHPLLAEPPKFPVFYDYIRDPRVPTTPATPWPHRPDSYILITAGADGLYGTKDDICNF